MSNRDFPSEFTAPFPRVEPVITGSHRRRVGTGATSSSSRTPTGPRGCDVRHPRVPSTVPGPGPTDVEESYWSPGQEVKGRRVGECRARLYDFH